MSWVEEQAAVCINLSRAFLGKAGRLGLAAALLLLGAACSAVIQDAPTPQPSPPPTVSPSPSPTPLGPTPKSPSTYTLPAQREGLPLDLRTLGPDNVEHLEPLREMSGEGVPNSIAAATLAFPSPFEFEVAALLDDGQLILWNMATAEVNYRDQEARAARHSGQHPALAVSRGFQGYLATGGTVSGVGEAQAVLLRTVDERREPLAYSGAGEAFTPDRVSALAFSPDGDRMAAGLGGAGGGLVKIWNLADDDALQRPLEIATDQAVPSLQFTPDGARLVASAGEALIEVDAATGGDLQLRTLDFPIKGHAIGAGGDSLAVWGDQAAVLEIPALGDPLEIPAADRLRRIDFSPDGRLALLVDGDRLRLWDLALGEEVVSYAGGVELLDGRFFDDGRLLVTIDARARVLLWGVQAGTVLPRDRTRIGPDNAGRLERVGRLYAPTGPQVHFLAGGDQLAVETAHGISLLDVPTLEVQRLLPHSERGRTGFAGSEDGRWLAWVGDGGSVALWDRERDQLARELSVSGEFCCAQLLFTPDGEHLVTLGESTAQVWEVQQGREVHAFDFVQKAHISPDGSRLALQQGLEVSLVDLGSGEVVVRLAGFETAAPVVDTEFSPDWEVMAWSSRATMQFSDVASGALGPAVRFSWGRFHPQGDRIAAVEDGWIMDTVGEVHEIDVRSGETLRAFDHQEDAIVDALAYSPDGRLLVTASEFSVRIWDAGSGSQLFQLPDAAQDVYRLLFAPDQTLLVTVARGDRVEFWAVPEAGGD